MKMFLCALLLLCVGLDFETVKGQLHQCGVRRLRQLQTRVIGGRNASIGRWPWQAQLLRRKSDGTYGHFCGGSLINDQWVVTATHCLFADPSPSMYKVKLGKNNRYVYEGSEQEFDVKEVRLHHGFLTDKEYGYDIAVIKLSRKVSMTPSVSPVCLPPPDQPIAAGTMCYLTGWGKIQYRSGPAPATILQEARLPIVSDAACQKGNGQLHIVDRKTMVCAGYGGNSIVSGCHGDGGGPLVCNEGGIWALRGVGSWGDNKCGAKTTYSVFARVSYFVHWIHNKMMTPPIVYSGCQDNHWYCANWNKQNVCQSNYYKNILKIYCPVSCGHCNAAI